MTIEVVKPGFATTIQDLGRPGYYHPGIPLSVRDGDQLWDQAAIVVGGCG
jgi:allophanate hydrolase subunit 2